MSRTNRSTVLSIVGVGVVTFIIGLAIGSATFYRTNTHATNGVITVYGYGNTTVYLNGQVITSSPSGCVGGVTTPNFCHTWDYVQNTSSYFILYRCTQGSPLGAEFCNSTTLYSSSK